MAGLQYYFFPTDYFYPRSAAPDAAVPSKSTVSVKPVNAVTEVYVSLDGNKGGDGCGKPIVVDGASPSGGSLVLNRSESRQQIIRGTPLVMRNKTG